MSPPLPEAEAEAEAEASSEAEPAMIACGAWVTTMTSRAKMSVDPSEGRNLSAGFVAGLISDTGSEESAGIEDPSDGVDASFMENESAN